MAMSNGPTSGRAVTVNSPGHQMDEDDSWRWRVPTDLDSMSMRDIREIMQNLCDELNQRVGM